jgi:hypothetical protein
MNSYPTELIISYNDDSEYRKCLYRLFGVDGDNYDDMYFNNNLADVFLDFVFKKTKNIYSFKKIYILAAATVMSTDQSIGSTVLVSYTYLELFHKCLCHYFRTLTTYRKDIEGTKSYQELLSLFQK